jgi:hypothetical protein
MFISGVIRTVPKYASILAINDYMEENAPSLVASTLPSESHYLCFSAEGKLTPVASAVKSVSACVTGVLLTHHIDVIHNE